MVQVFAALGTRRQERPTRKLSRAANLPVNAQTAKMPFARASEEAGQELAPALGGRVQ